MIDLLGIIYSNQECPYYNHFIDSYNNRDGKSIPCIKVFTDDNSAAIPSKAWYSDAGYDFTIIKECKRLTANAEYINKITYNFNKMSTNVKFCNTWCCPCNTISLGKLTLN
jgi:hypothetical protein